MSNGCFLVESVTQTIDPHHVSRLREHPSLTANSNISIHHPSQLSELMISGLITMVL